MNRKRRRATDGGGALCEALEGLADPHASPVEGPGQGDEHQEQQHGPRGVDALVGLGLHPRSSLREKTKGRFRTKWDVGAKARFKHIAAIVTSRVRDQSGSIRGSRQLELQLSLKMFSALIFITHFYNPTDSLVRHFHAKQTKNLLCLLSVYPNKPTCNRPTQRRRIETITS